MQWTGERLGSVEKTEAPPDFKQLEIETETRKEGIDNMVGSLGDFLKTMDERKSPPLYKFGKTVLQQGKFHGADSIYGMRVVLVLGMSMTKIGEGLEKIALLQGEFAASVRQTVFNDLESLAEGLKEFERVKKKLENRRLDFDAKQNKLAKSKKDKPDLLQEAEIAREKYEETQADMEKLMLSFRSREVKPFVICRRSSLPR